MSRCCARLCGVWVWSDPGQARFGLGLPLAGEAAPVAQDVGPLGVMIASFGNSTLLIRVKFPKLAIMSSGLVALVPNPAPRRPGDHRHGQGPRSTQPATRSAATSPPAKSATVPALLLPPVAIARS